MCRLAYFSNKAIRELDEKKLVEFLDYLEKRNGGHGNGIGGLLTNGKFFVYKGTDVISEELVEVMKEMDWVNGVIYHTRLASSGNVNDFLCHPFISLNRDCLLAHNGHVGGASTLFDFIKAIYPDRYENYEYSSYRVYSNLDQYVREYLAIKESEKICVSDSWVATEMLSFLANVFNNDELIERFHNYFADFGNYFVQLKNGIVYCVVGWRDFEMYYNDEFVVCASEGLREVLNLKRVYTLRDGIVKINNSDVTIIKGIIRRKRKKKRKRTVYVSDVYESIYRVSEWFKHYGRW